MTGEPRREGEPATASTTTPGANPHAADIEAEHAGWDEFVQLVRRLSPDERLLPGYYSNPDWSVRDVVGHVGTWLAEAGVQLERIRGGTYEGHDVDVDALNAQFLEAMRDQPWDVTWIQAQAARARLLQEWFDLPDRNDEAAWWIRKSGPEHYAEHLARLREWVRQLTARRASATPARAAGTG
jgi:hypothetical protein